MNTIYITILDQIRTIQEMDGLIQGIDEILKGIYHVNHETIASVLTSSLRPELTHTLVATL